MIKSRRQVLGPLMESSEFSRPTFLKDVPASGACFSLVASDVECKALAQRFNLPNILSLQAEVMAVPLTGGEGVHITGSMSARLIQECSVTLEHFENVVNVSFGREYAFSASSEGCKSVLLHLDVDDPPEGVPNGWVDLGDVVSEELGLGINPFPRRPGVDFVFNDEGEREQECNPGPFSVLGRLPSKK